MQRVVKEFYSVCKRRKLKVNAGKSKVMVFERREEEVVDFNPFGTGFQRCTLTQRENKPLSSYVLRYKFLC